MVEGEGREGEEVDEEEEDSMGRFTEAGLEGGGDRGIDDMILIDWGRDGWTGEGTLKGEEGEGERMDVEGKEKVGRKMASRRARSTAAEARAVWLS